MTKLTDLQSLLLTHAAAREDGGLTALPESAGVAPDRAMTAITQLLRRGLLEEREVDARAAHHRADGDLRYGAFITVAGLTAIGAVGSGGDTAASAPAAAAPQPAPERQSKAALVLDLLRRDDGATLPELVSATGWLPHTTRAALTGLRKKGHAIERERRDGVSRYRLAAAK